MADENPGAWNASILGQLNPSRALGSLGNIIQGRPPWSGPRPFTTAEATNIAELGKTMASRDTPPNMQHWMQGLAHLFGRGAGLCMMGRSAQGQQLAANDQRGAVNPPPASTTTTGAVIPPPTPPPAPSPEPPPLKLFNNPPPGSRN